MEETLTLQITCPCVRQSCFEHQLKIKRSKRPAPMVVQIECPFANEQFCLKTISLKLPKGSQPAPDENLLRGD